jgi:uncharacterized membrane protein YfcA
MNAVAGGGTFLTFPALVFIGLPSVAANQTSTIAVFPGQVASFWAYRKILAAALQFVIGVYGGFYGAGAGILELAVLDLLGLENIHLANALKVILTTAFNVLALVISIMVGNVFWPQGLLMGLATIGGGYGGAWGAQRLPQAWVRRFVTAIGALMTAYFFARLY